MNATKLWKKNNESTKDYNWFTVGKDNEFDYHLAPFDVLASIAHAKMLNKVGLIKDQELNDLLKGLNEINELLVSNNFNIEEGVEDIHSQIEFYLTKNYGDCGKKIHTGRSRNDQVLTAIKLYLKSELKLIKNETDQLISLFNSLAHQHKGKLMPGYTHLQIAMPSSFDLWFGAYAESLEDDLLFVDAAIKICDKNPLGSGAGYGSSFPIDRAYTTQELSFSDLNYSPVYAQMTRGKSEKACAAGIASIAYTLSKFSYDVCLFLCQNFGFISFPDYITTGSSIMPHKKNPDIFELIRAKCNIIQGIPNQLTLLTNNLPSGYHRDLQLTKEVLLPAIKELKDCIKILLEILPNIEVKDHLLNDEKYKYLFSVEEVNKLVLNGDAFRDAYHKVSSDIQTGNFNTDKKIKHTHLGSIGNPK